MTDWLELGPEMRRAFKQHPVLGLLLVFLLGLWTIALRTKIISLGDMVGLTLAIVILGLLSEGIIRIIRRNNVFPSVLFDETHGQERWRDLNPGAAPTIDMGYKCIAEITGQHYDVKVLKAGGQLALRSFANMLPSF